MKLWELNTEFDIEILYPYTFNFPMLSIKEKDGKLLLSCSLWDKSLKEYMRDLYERYPNSEFLEKLFK